MQPDHTLNQGDSLLLEISLSTICSAHYIPNNCFTWTASTERPIPQWYGMNCKPHSTFKNTFLLLFSCRTFRPCFSWKTFESRINMIDYIDVQFLLGKRMKEGNPSGFQPDATGRFGHEEQMTKILWRENFWDLWLGSLTTWANNKTSNSAVTPSFLGSLEVID